MPLQNSGDPPLLKSPLGSGAAAVSGAETLEVGQKVEARFGKKSRFYPGTITKSNGDGTYDILYNDGDSEKSVDASLIKVRGGKDADAILALQAAAQNIDNAYHFQVGDEVETRGKDKVEWVRGKIISRHRDASFDIECQDGDVETNVQASFIRMLPGSPSKANKALKAAVKDLETESADALDHVAAAADCLEHNSAAIPATHETEMDDVKTAAKVSDSQSVVAVANSNDINGVRKKIDGEGNATKFEGTVSDEKSLRDLPTGQSSDDNNELRGISDTHKEMQEGVLKDQKIIAMSEQIRLLERRYKSSMEELTRIRALQADPGRDPKIRRILDSLVLLREAPSRWDRLRSAFFRRCKLEKVKHLRLFDHLSDNCLYSSSLIPCTTFCSSRCRGSYFSQS